eukprot:5556928-Ditylum_brightwellii.AAC.1
MRWKEEDNCVCSSANNNNSTDGRNAGAACPNHPAQLESCVSAKGLYHCWHANSAYGIHCQCCGNVFHWVRLGSSHSSKAEHAPAASEALAAGALSCVKTPPGQCSHSAI